MATYGARSLVEESYHALDNHLRYWSYIGTSIHQAHLANFMPAYGFDKDLRPGELGMAVAQWTMQEREVWDGAATILLDPDVHRTVAEAMESMPDAPLRAEDVPVQSGVLLMPDDGIILEYANHADIQQGLALPITAIAWQINRIGAIDPETRKEERVPGIDIWIYASPRWLFERAPDIEASLRRAPLIIIDRTPWAFGRTWKGLSDYRKDEYRRKTIFDETGTQLIDPQVSMLRRFLMALFIFMRDEIVAMPRPTTIPRALGKRFLRSKKVDFADGMLRIAQLRKINYVGREHEVDEDASSREYTHRWWVRGHWRHLSSGRITWVRPHIKGPDDKPLVLKNDIVAVRR